MRRGRGLRRDECRVSHRCEEGERDGDRKSTRLNSSHSQISYAVFCLHKKKPMNQIAPTSSDVVRLVCYPLRSTCPLPCAMFEGCRTVAEPTTKTSNARTINS